MEEWKEWEVFFKQELEKKLAILQKNCLAVPEAERRTRYGKQYFKLRRDVAGLAEEYVRLHVGGGVCFQEEDRSMVIQTVNRIFAEEDASGQMRAALYQERDMERVMDIAERLRIRVWKETKKWHCRGYVA